MTDYTTVGDLARDIAGRAGQEVRPRDITDLFYKRLLPDDRCPVLGGRRLIPVNLRPAIEAKLRERGLLGVRVGEGRV